MSDTKGWTARQVTVLIIIAALGGYVLGRLSTNLHLRIGGAAGGGEVPGDSADFVLDDPGPLAEDSDRLPLADAPFMGPGAAKVTIVEFSDFQCPFCQRATPVVHQIMERYEGDVRFAFVNLPLPMHPEAEPAARAAVAAQRQGHFWEYHDLLFQNRDRLGAALYDELAEELDLDMDQFHRDLEDPAVAERVRNDRALARSVGVDGTPSFLVNGVPVVGAQPIEAFGSTIDAELEAADALLDEGVPITEVFRRRLEENLPAPNAREPRPAEAPPAEEGQHVPERPTTPPAAIPGGADPSAPSGDAAPTPPAELAPPPIPDGHAEVTVYADFSDPTYRALGRTLVQLMDDYGDRLDVDFESYVDPTDEAAVLTAAALREAEAEGLFAPYHRLLLESEGPVTRERLEAWSGEAGLDPQTFQAALDGDGQAAAESARRDAARAAGVILSPTVRVGDARLVGAVPYEDLRVAVNASMERE